VYKVAWLARFPRGGAKDEADAYWAQHHGPLFAQVPGVKGYVQSHVTGPLPSITGVTEEKTQFDGYSCAWWEDESAFRAAMESPEWRAVVEDGANVFDMEWLWNMSAQIEEVTQISGPIAPYKVVWVMKFKEGITRRAADEHWTDVHGAFFHPLPIERYVQNHVVGPIGAQGAADTEIGFDGFSECWFADESQFLQAVNTAGWADAVADVPNIFDGDRMWGAALREHVLIDPVAGAGDEAATPSTGAAGRPATAT
jgi:uncharacterized protein (TIGR02118 family)